MPVLLRLALLSALAASVGGIHFELADGVVVYVNMSIVVAHSKMIHDMLGTSPDDVDRNFSLPYINAERFRLVRCACP